MLCIQSEETIIALIILLILFMAMIHVFIRYVHQVRQCILRSDAFMMSRYPNIAFPLLVVSLLDLCVIQPGNSILLIFFYHERLELVATGLTDLRFIIFGFFFIARMYLLHYDYEYGKECVRLLWADASSTYYIDHRHILGNDKYTIKFTALCCAVCLSILLIMHIVEWSGTIWLRSAVYTAEGIAVCVLYLKVNYIHDKFGIKQEMLYVLICPALCGCVYHVLRVINMYTAAYGMCTESLLYVYFMFLMTCSNIFINAKVPLNYRSHAEHQHTMRLMQIGDDVNRVRFQDVLGSASAFRLFVHHLESEFAVENILFLVEVAKYREYFLSQLLMKPKYGLLLERGTSIRVSAGSPMLMPHTLSNARRTQRSAKFSMLIDFDVVQEYIRQDLFVEQDIQKFVEPLTADFIPTPNAFERCTVREAALNIYRQFVEEMSTHMINLSWPCRCKIQQLVEECDKLANEELALIFLFDEAFNQIYAALLSDTFLRFKVSDKFKHYLKGKRLPTQDEVAPTNGLHTSPVQSFTLSLQGIHDPLHSSGYSVSTVISPDSQNKKEETKNTDLCLFTDVPSVDIY